MFRGSMVALVTPMSEDGSVDFDAVERLVEFHADNGTDALVVAGTTGESATLTELEYIELVRRVVACTRERMPVIAGSGTAATSRTIALTRHAMEAGADACLLVTPYYNKPGQEGLYRHYRAVADAVPIPQILYNVPGRTACDLLPETVARLAELPNVIGIKEATGSIERARQVRELVGDRLDLYSGDDPTARELMLDGAHGVISVTANVAPKLMQEMCAAALAGDAAAAAAVDARLAALHKGMFVESNPIPAKWALHAMGLIGPTLRLPLTELESGNRATVADALAQAGIQLQNGA
ncbi:MAG: 4-hydroxy-tetrahydrodipicolinate synthase [Xanthomonadaceae bacterium]|nr:4-hydroxy-tetrahydrodipicolinate synthase [Xanthomonadaceae bacterium]